MNRNMVRYIDLLLQKGKFIFIVSDEDFITETVNPYFTEITEYKPEEIIGKRSIDVLDPPEFRKDIKKALKELETKGKFRVNENPIVTKSGKIKHILWYNVWDKENKRHISIGVDITELRDTQEKLKEKDEYLRHLTSEAGAYIWRTLIDGDREKTIYYTDSIENVLGYPKESFLDKDFVPHNKAFFRKIIHPEDLRDFEKSIEETLKKGEPLRKEVRVIKSNGEIIWLYEYMAPILKDDQVIEVVGIGIDITKSKQRELDLEEKTRELDFLLNTINAYIFRLFLHKNGKVDVLFYSNGIKNVTGYDREEFFNGKISWEKIVLPEDRELHRIEAEEKVFKGIPAFVEYRIKRKDGKIIWVMDSFYPILKENGVDIVGVCMNIDERKRLEEEKRELEKLQAMGVIAGGTAHVFNNILTGILGYTSLLKMRFSPFTSEYKMLTNIENGIKNMSNINEKLLGYVRLGKYEEKEINLRKIIEEEVKELQKKTETKGHLTIHTHFSSFTCPVIIGDRKQLKTMFSILFETIIENNKNIEISLGVPNFYNSEIKEEFLKRKQTLPKEKYLEIKIKVDIFKLEEEDFEGIFEPTLSPQIAFSDKGLNFPAIYGIVKSHGGFVYISTKKNIINLYFPCS